MRSPRTPAFLSVCLKPVVAPAVVRHEWDGERVGVFHLVDDDVLDPPTLVRLDHEAQLVVHLKYHLRPQLLFLESLVDSHHGYLYYVS